MAAHSFGTLIGKLRLFVYVFILRQVKVWKVPCLHQLHAIVSSEREKVLNSDPCQTSVSFCLLRLTDTHFSAMHLYGPVPQHLNHYAIAKPQWLPNSDVFTQYGQLYTLFSASEHLYLFC